MQSQMNSNQTIYLDRMLFIPPHLKKKNVRGYHKNGRGNNKKSKLLVQ